MPHILRQWRRGKDVSLEAATIKTPVRASIPTARESRSTVTSEESPFEVLPLALKRCGVIEAERSDSERTQCSLHKGDYMFS